MRWGSRWSSSCSRALLRFGGCALVIFSLAAALAPLARGVGNLAEGVALDGRAEALRQSLSDMARRRLDCSQEAAAILEKSPQPWAACGLAPEPPPGPPPPGPPEPLEPITCEDDNDANAEEAEEAEIVEKSTEDEVNVIAASSAVSEKLVLRPFLLAALSDLLRLFFISRSSKCSAKDLLLLRADLPAAVVAAAVEEVAAAAAAPPPPPP